MTFFYDSINNKLNSLDNVTNISNEKEDSIKNKLNISNEAQNNEIYENTPTYLSTIKDI